MKTKIWLSALLLVFLVACTTGSSAGDAVEAEPYGLPVETPTAAPTEDLAPVEEPVPTAVPPTRTTDTVEEPTSEDHAALREALAGLVNRQVAELGFPSAVLHVTAPDIGFTWASAAGLADPAGQVPLIPEDQYALASVTKMFTAGVVVGLVERGALRLDDPIARYIPADLVARLHILDGESYGGVVTVQQLLNHTTGWADFTNGVDADGNGIPDMKDLVQAEPDTRWATDAVVDYALETAPPLFAPGEAWAYSDLNYQVLGMIVETVTEQELHEIYRGMVFDPLGMEHTYLEFREDPVPGAGGRGIAHMFYREWDWTGHASRSYDWSAGGIVSTAAEQSDFMWALVQGELFDTPSTTDMMYGWVDTGFPGWSYGAGLFKIDLASLDSPGLGHLVGHGGTWNSFLYYVPEMNLVLAGTLNSSEPSFGHMGMVIEALYTIQAMSGP